MICCFFGHRDTPDSIRTKLEETIRQLIYVIVERIIKNILTLSATISVSGKLQLLQPAQARELKQDTVHVAMQLKQEMLKRLATAIQQ